MRFFLGETKVANVIQLQRSMTPVTHGEKSNVG